MHRLVIYGSFVWDADKESYNKHAHGLSFVEATHAFFDSKRIIAVDEAHSRSEDRMFCIGKIGNKVATVRFTYRGNRIRIIGAGYWRKGRKLYEEKNKKR